MKNFTVSGIGELLWDVFPDGKRLGGAPMNFCYHCRQFGAEGFPVSAVGTDSLGAELRTALAINQVPDQFVMQDDVHPTGTVQVTLEGAGLPSYEICEGVAWDYISLSEGARRLASKSAAACFGSLAQRNKISRNAIQAFILGMKPEALKIFDINLRQTFYSKEVVEESLKLCNVVKLNDEELPVVAEMFGIHGSIKEQLGTLLEWFDLKMIAYTRGPDGSLLITSDEVSDHSGCPGDAINSVGAGDSFTAALCMGILNKRTLDEINEHANCVATFVCSQNGATPILPEKLKGKVYA